MKMYLFVLIIFQLSEVGCYAILYAYIHYHQSQMVTNNIISRDVYQARKSVHMLSFYAQVSAFLVEVIYLAAQSLVKVIGRRFFPSNILELINALKATEYGVTSTVQILMTPDLRQKIFTFIKRNR